MALTITPSHVEAVYECLRAFEPWRGLKLPEAEEIEFHVRNRRDIYAEYRHNGTAHQIKLSTALIGTFQTLAETVGHEMLHLAQAEKGTATASEHNAEWRALARKACRVMGWDERAF